ncbi:TPA: hypothetical protein ACH3X2_010043 [Trebouxia sp. C0005]|nr:MAG: subunit of the ESCRT-I complex [Trebouxia sp. A1-2]
MQGYKLSGAAQGRGPQVTDLLSRIISCRPLNRDQSLFEVPLWLPDGRSTAVRITLPPSFPQAQPSIAVTSPLRHANVKASGHLSFPSLDFWDPQSSKLADIVEEACTMLSSPPDDDWQLISAASGSSNPSSLQQRDSQSAQQQPPHTQQRPTSRSASPAKQQQQTGTATNSAHDFAELASLSNEELAALLLDDAKYRSLVSRILSRSSATQVQDSVRKSIIDMANSNLEKEQLISEVKNHIAIVRSSEYAAAKEQFDSRLQRQSAALTKLKPDVLIAKLAKASREADDQAEALYDEYIAGSTTIEHFIASYCKQKTVAHARNLKSTAALQTLR